MSFYSGVFCDTFCWHSKAIDNFRGTQRQFSENICSEDNLRSSIFGTFVVKFLACLSLRTRGLLCSIPKSIVWSETRAKTRSRAVNTRPHHIMQIHTIISTAISFCFTSIVEFWRLLLAQFNTVFGTHHWFEIRSCSKRRNHSSSVSYPKKLCRLFSVLKWVNNNYFSFWAWCEIIKANLAAHCKCTCLVGYL